MGPGAAGPEQLIGQKVTGYTLTKLLGVGATGAVFLATRQEDSSTLFEKTGSLPIERPYEAAIKLLILPWQLTPDERADFRSRFLREAETLKKLRQPNILSVLAYGEDADAGFTYMVLPYLSGGTMATYISSRTEPMPLAEVAASLSQLASALDYAHSQGVIHRDIKPANILLDERNAPFLSDFSIVRLLAETATRLTTTGRIMGTPAYMSPEQVTGAPLGPASDIYSLGMVVYEMVTGRTAFQSATLMDLIRQQAQTDPAPPRQFRPDLPEPASAAILCALAKNPAHRFATAQAFAEAFTLGLTGQWSPALTALLAMAQQRVAAASTPTMTAAPPFQGWAETAPVAVNQPRKRGFLAPLFAAAITLLLVSTLALIASNPSVVVGFFGGVNTPTIGHAALATTSDTVKPGQSPTQGQQGGPPTATTASHNPGPPTATVLPGAPTPTPTNTPTNTPTLAPGVTPTDTPIPTATDTPTDTPTPTATPTPTNTPTPQPTPTATPCPYLNGGTGVTFYDSSNYSGNWWRLWVAPGQVNTTVNLPAPIAGHLNSIWNDNQAWTVVVFQNQNGTGNLGFYYSSQPSISPYWQATQSVRIYVNRSC
ncbi:MAG TPA: serine/threonine-protein kinase [Ktedonobacterales bacterium]|nr:serine/threonine-protein kinase [Ktedonobacterales bacterium]